MFDELVVDDVPVALHIFNVVSVKPNDLVVIEPSLLKCAQVKHNFLPSFCMLGDSMPRDISFITIWKVE